MNTHRKIRILSSITIVSAAIALGLLAPPAAMATSCPPAEVCVGLFTCNGWTQAQRNQACSGQTPPGCTLNNAICISTICASLGGILCTYH
jgi:hypothetical protein